MFSRCWNSFQTNQKRYEKIHETAFQIKEKTSWWRWKGRKKDNSIFQEKKQVLKVCSERKVLVRFGKKGKKAPKRRHVIIGKAVKIGKHGGSYKIQYKDPISKCQTTSLFSVEDIANLQKQKEARRKSYCQTRLLAMIKKPYDAFEDQCCFHYLWPSSWK